MSMVRTVTAAVAAAWALTASDAVVESAISDGPALRLFGRTVATLPAHAEGLAIGALACSVGAVVTLGVSTGQRARAWRELRGRLDERWEELSKKNAGLEERNERLRRRIPELQQQIHALSKERDELLDETARISDRTKELRDLANESRDALHNMAESLSTLPETKAPEPTEQPR